MPGHNPRRVLLVAAITMSVDWITKYLAVSRISEAHPVDLGFVLLRVRRNPGIAFSMGDSLPSWAVLAITGTIITGLTVMALRGYFRPPVAAGLIVGGGLGNLIDRAINGSVIDMVEVGWWPTFNVADVALNVGVGLILLWSFRHGGDEVEVAPGPGGAADGQPAGDA